MDAVREVVEQYAAGQPVWFPEAVELPSFEAPQCRRLEIETIAVEESMASAVLFNENERVAIVLLQVDTWRIISILVAGKGEANEALDAAKAYMSANRAESKEAMAKVFHEKARLTYVAERLVIVPQPEFLDRVANRDCRLRDDPRVLANDKIQSVHFFKDAAVVRLTVAFPPVIYSDILFFAKIDGHFMIVAKSSVNAPFLDDE